MYISLYIMVGMTYQKKRSFLSSGFPSVECRMSTWKKKQSPSKRSFSPASGCPFFSKVRQSASQGRPMPSFYRIFPSLSVYEDGLQMCFREQIECKAENRMFTVPAIRILCNGRSSSFSFLSLPVKPASNQAGQALVQVGIPVWSLSPPCEGDWS